MLRIPGAQAVDVNGHPGVLLAPPRGPSLELAWDLGGNTKVVLEPGPPVGPGNGPVSVDTLLALARSVHPVSMAQWQDLERQAQIEFEHGR
jgi:hypothetical protein